MTDPIAHLPPKPREEGAAMLIVMLVLLMVTATATFAMHSTAYEIRAAGHTRMATQSYYVADTGITGALGWVDAIGAQAVDSIFEQHEEADRQLELSPLEPSLATDKFAHRIYGEDLGAMGSPIGRNELGPRQIYEPQITVDIYDHHTFPAVSAGHRSDGHGSMEFFRATYVSRGRVRIPGDADARHDVTVRRRDYNEGARDMRAVAVSGPYMDDD